MDWNKAKQIFMRDPWLVGTISPSGIVSPDIRQLQKWIREKVHHISFLPFEKLDLKALPFFERHQAAHSLYRDSIWYETTYQIRFHLEGEEPFNRQYWPATNSTVREAIKKTRPQNLSGILIFDAVVQHIEIGSVNFGRAAEAYQIYKFPENFRLDAV